MLVTTGAVVTGAVVTGAVVTTAGLVVAGVALAPTLVTLAVSVVVLPWEVTTYPGVPSRRVF